MNSRRLAALALAVAFSLIWSSAFIAAKIAVTDIDPATTLTLRFGLGALVLAPMATRREARLGIGLGLLNNAAYLGLSFSAMALTRPVVVIAIASCAPFLTSALAGLLGVERVRARQVAGALIGLAGAWIVTGFDGAGANAAGIGLASAGVLCFSIGTLLFRAKGHAASIASLNFWQSLAGALALAPIAILFGHGVRAMSTADALAILYLAVPVTIGAMAMWLALIRLVGAASASAAHLMNPFFGALMSWAVLGSPLLARDFIGAAVIAIGLALSLGLGRPSGPPSSSR